MRGIEFSGYTTCCSILDGISTEAYDWYLYEDEIIENEKYVEYNTRITGLQLREIMANENNSFIFMNLQAFPKGTVGRKIRDYDDFLASDCSFIVLITDASLVEIYTKNTDDLVRFISNAEKCNSKEIRIKIAHSDGRKIFSIR